MQGEYCARNPREVLISCCVAVLILSLGLFRFRVETDPQRLWVGRGSRALADKQAYEVRVLVLRWTYRRKGDPGRFWHGC